MTLLSPPAPPQPQPRRADDDPDHRTRIADEPRVLFPFAAPFDESALDVAVGLARADGATLVAVYLTVVPLRFHEDSPDHEPSWLAAPLLDVVERAALGHDVTVSTRIRSGRTLRHGLRRLLKDERFSSIVAPAPAEGERGFSESDLAWLVAHAPAATLVLKPGYAGQEDRSRSARAPWPEAILAALTTHPTPRR